MRTRPALTHVGLRWPWLLAAALGAGSCATPAPPAPPPTPARETSCAFRAFVKETDPAGLNVREAPGTASRIVGRLPPMRASEALDGYLVKVEVEVLGSRDGWFRIARATDNTALTGRPARPMYDGEGWVSGRKLTVKSQATRGFRQPDESSEPVLRVLVGGNLDADSVVETSELVACSGRWALVEFDPARMLPALAERLEVAPAARTGAPAGRFRAWVQRLCGLQETSCDGLGSDEQK